MPEQAKAPGTPITIVIADDHEVVRAGLRRLLESQSELEVVGEAADGESACEVVRSLRPDVLIVDLSMPKMSGTQTTERLRREAPEVKVVVFTVHEEPSYVEALLQAGARGYVLKRSPPKALVKAVLEVAAGNTYVDTALGHSLLSLVRDRSSEDVPPAVQLSPRERDVLVRIARGYSNKEIAAAMRLSVKTVETYKARFAAKLDLRSRVAIVRFAARQGWLEEGTPR